MSYLLHLLSACVLPDVLGVSNLSGMTGMTDWLHLLFRLFLLLGNTEIFDGFHCLSPLLVTLLRPLFPLLGVTLLLGVTIGLGRWAGKLGICGAEEQKLRLHSSNQASVFLTRKSFTV